MKIALLGPAPPFHGGIVTYLAMLARVMQERSHQVFWSSFKKQYPGFLFPGTNQTGDTADWMQRPNTPRFVPWSPLSWQRTAADLIAQKPDAVIIKYWLPFFAPGFWWVARKLRSRGIPVIYILDNVIAHEKYPFAGLLTRMALGQGSGFVAQSDQVRRDLFTTVPQTDPDRVIDCPHPVYDFGVPGRERKTKAEARRSLGIPDDARLVLFFGFIKAYKGVMHLIDAAPQLRESLGDDLRVLIVGDVYGDKQPYLDAIERQDLGEALQLVDGYVPDEVVEDYFLACDLVALPYVSATQSGIVQIAYNYDRPVVSTAVGGLPEVVLDGRTGFLVPPEDPAALADAITRYFEDALQEEFTAAVQVEKKKYSWERMAQALETLAGKR
jgi:D-inositol-3-phosphate glycosyltransferase